MAVSTPLLVALALGPGFLLVHAIYVADRHEKEPIRNLLRYSIAGALLCVPAAIVEGALLRVPALSAAASPEGGFVALAVSALLAIALVEELAKRVAIHLCARRDRDLNEPFDWIVYSVSVSLGFATFENVLFVIEGGVAVGLVRALTAVPAHALNGTLMGDRLARSAAGRGRGRANRWLAVVEPALWHGAYDFLVLSAVRASSRGDSRLTPTLCAALFALIAAQWAVGVRRVRAMQREAPSTRRLPPILYPTLLTRRDR